MSESNGVKPSPTFDFSKVSRRWHRSFIDSINTATRAQITLQRQIPQGADPDAINRLLDRQEEALTIIDTMSRKQAELAAEVLTGVPEEWLAVDAPAEIDWSQVDSLDYLQPGYYGLILEMLRSGEAMVRKDAKN